MIMTKNSNNDYVEIEDIVLKKDNKYQNIESNELPLQFKGKGKDLKDYRIYGQTENGESVGDRTGNLFNGDLRKGYWINTTDLGQTSSEAFRSFKIFLPAGTYTLSFEINVNIVRLIADGTLTQNVGNNLAEYTVTTQTDGDIGFSFRLTGTTQVPWDNSDIMLNEGSTALPYEPYGYKVPVTVEGKNLFNNIWKQGNIRADNGQKEASNIMICSDYFPVEYDKTYSISRTISEGYNNVRGYDASKNYIGGGTTVCSVNNPFANSDTKKGIFKITNSLVAFVRFNHYSNNLNMKYMIVEGDYTNTPIPPYEPYREPVITNLYLPEQIKMVGDEAEYIDYGEQKQHRVRKNLFDVTAQHTVAYNTCYKYVISGLNPNLNYTCSTNYNQKDHTDACVYFCGALTATNGVWQNEPKTYKPNNDGEIIILIRFIQYHESLPIYDAVVSGDIWIMVNSGSTPLPYEPYIENTELDVTLPALPTLSGTNTLTVGTNTKPSKVWGKLSDPRDILYVKDNLGNILFSKYHEIEGEPPLIYKAKKAGTLTDYHIYGAEGNVGNLRPSLVAATDFTNGYHVATDGTIGEHGKRVATLTPIDVSAINTIYVNSGINTLSDPVIIYSLFSDDTFIERLLVNGIETVINTEGANKLYLSFGGESKVTTANLNNVYVMDNDKMYVIPVMVTNETDTQTTNIYLPEQIKMVGDETEYADYQEQKLHRVRKNLLQNTASSQTKNGVTFTVNNDGSVTCNGTASNNTFFKIGDFSLASQSYILTGCPSDGGNDSYTLRCYENGSIKGEDVGNGFNINESIDGYIEIRIASGYTCDNPTFYPMIRKADITDDTYESYITNPELDVTLPALPTLSGINTLSVGTAVQPSKINIKGKIKGKIYGWHVDPDISNSSGAVTYLEDAREMFPASMRSTTFNYGSWKNAFFMPKPCMLKSNGKVDYYLDPNDYTKKLDGTTSDIANPNYDGNAMMQWPKIWFKYVKGVKKGQGYFYVANYKADGNFHCWCNYDSEDNEIDHFYTAIYNGTSFANYNSSKTYVVNDFAIYNNKLYKCNTDIATAESFDNAKWDLVSNTAPVINKMRSLSGIRLTNNNGNAQTTTTTEITRATANNTTSAAEWYIETFSDRLLINGLLVLMGKSLNTQAVFGRGLDTGGQPAKEAYVTGTLNDKGLFWGVTENGNSGVKIFGMENFWGCCWHRTAGLITNNHAVKLKLTYGTKDGSTVVGYNQTGNGYIDNGISPHSNGYVQKMSYNKYGFMPAVVIGGIQSTYYADYHYQNNYTGIIYALFGGSSADGLGTGAFYLRLYSAPEHMLWIFAASLSCKPLLN